MTPSDLVARLKDDADYLQTWIDDGLETDFTMDPDGMRNQQKHFRDCAAAIEQLQAELVQAKQAVDCWFEDAKNLAEFKVTVATGINMTLERYRELVEIMEDRDRITGYLRERNQECADLKTERDALRAELAAIRTTLDSSELLESLAAVEHNRWSGWMRYQETASAERRADWPRKTELAYTQLTHDEQESDREEVRNTLLVIKAALNAARAQAGGK